MAFSCVLELHGVAEEMEEEKLDMTSNYNAPFNLLTAACDRSDHNDFSTTDIKRQIATNAFFDRDCLVRTDISDEDLQLMESIVAETLMTAKDIPNRQIQVRSCDDRLVMIALDRNVPWGQSKAHCIRAKPHPTWEEKEQMKRRANNNAIVAIFISAVFVVTAFFAISLIGQEVLLTTPVAFFGIVLFYGAMTMLVPKPVPELLTRHSLLL